MISGFKPEFLRAATALEDAMNPWHIVIGTDGKAKTDRLVELYKKFVGGDAKKISFCNIHEAELIFVSVGTPTKPGGLGGGMAADLGYLFFGRDWRLDRG